MIVLGIDTATPATVAGVLLADGRVVEARDDPPRGLARRSTRAGCCR